MRALREAERGVVYLREVVVAIREREGKGEIAGNPQCPNQNDQSD